MQNRGLGKGFDSLIPSDIKRQFDPTTDQDEKVSRTKNLFINDIKPNPRQPRREFDEQALKELTTSIARHGVLQPIVVVMGENEDYILVAGERRLRAAKLAGLKDIPAIVRSFDDQTQLEVALIENIQREDLSPLEMAAAFLKLNEQFNQDLTDIAKRVGKAESTVINTIRLLQLPNPARQALIKGSITEGHARQILALKDGKRQQELLDLIIRHGWSVRRAEQFVIAIKEGAKDSQDAVTKTALETDQTRRLADWLKVPVTVNKMAKGGKLVIRYRDDDDLSRITDLLIKPD